MVISFKWRPPNEKDEEFFKRYPNVSKFIYENTHACFMNFRYSEVGHLVGTINVKYSIFTKIVEWIHKQSEGNIQITLMYEHQISENVEDVKTVLFKVDVSNAYTPLSRYIAFYMTMITLRMSDDYEKFYTIFEEGEVEEFNGRVYMLMNDYGCSGRGKNSNHCAFFIPSYEEDSPVSLPEEVYNSLFDVTIFNEAFKERFCEYSYDLFSTPYVTDLDKKVSQTACLLRICRHLKLLEKLIEIRLKDYGEKFNGRLMAGKKGKSKVLKDFKLGLDNYRRVHLRRKNPLYEPPENKFKPKLLF